MDVILRMVGLVIREMVGDVNEKVSRYDDG